MNTKGVFFTVFVFFVVDSRNQRDKMQEDMTIFSLLKKERIKNWGRHTGWDGS